MNTTSNFSGIEIICKTEPRLFVTADTHFFHSKVIEYQNRPFTCVEEMNETLIQHWNEDVRPKDKIIVLGDFAFGKASKVNEVLRRLNGQKQLIKGSHDHFITQSKFDKTLFESIKAYDTVEFGGKLFVLFHYPIAVWQNSRHGSIHLHGHMHGHKVEGLTFAGKAFDVGVDCNNLRPVWIGEYLNK